MHQPATHPAVLAPTPFASPYAVGHQPDVLHRIVEVFRKAARRGGPATVLSDGPSDCRFHIEAPEPDAALVAYAASLGINESGGDELGIQFAETVTIRCE